MNKGAKLSSIPSLRTGNGKWVLDSHDKANEFAANWMSKNKLPAPCCDEIYPGPQKHVMNDNFKIRTRNIKQILLKLDVSKATGPYTVANTRILKMLAAELALPIATLSRRIFYEGRWPTKWRLHNLVPIFKRSSVYLANNYRGIHMTCNVSKIVEKVLKNPLISFLEKHGYGNAQWAFRKESSARDLLLVLVSTWIRKICMGRKIGLYLSDIAGAFDRVDKDCLMLNFFSIGVSDQFLDFLNSYLEPRIGRVTVEGAYSDTFDLCNMIYQGTVLGPPLWNVFFMTSQMLLKYMEHKHQFVLTI